ncbi:MAG: hybrid sensor histidine kinase/response regulator [bacterium]
MDSIILVSKDSQIISVLKKLCEQEGFLPQVISTSEEFRITKDKCPLVIMDLDNTLEIKDIGENVPIIALGEPTTILSKFNPQYLDIITKPIFLEILQFKLKKIFEKIRLTEELKKTKRELETVDKDAEHAYDEWEKTTRVLRTSLMEVEKERNELEILNKELERLNKVKSDLLVTVSHELRTPLTSIKGLAEILLDEQIEPDERMEFLRIINDESERLGRLINNLLTLSRIEIGKLKWEKRNISIDKIIEDTVSKMSVVANKKGVELKMEVSDNLPYVYGDEDKLVEVLINLINNAVNFTPSGGEIKITATNAQDEIWISVSDTGIGIRTEEQEKIFDKFYQIKDNILSDKPTGMGLGLAICKEIIDHHQGKIWVDCPPEGGATFTFSLPVSKYSVKGEQQR